MHPLPLNRLHRLLFGTVLGAASLACSLGSGFGFPTEESSNLAKNLARMNCGAQIECTTPDGRVAAVPAAENANQSAAALIMDDDTVSCPLQSGDTTFVVKLPSTALLDRFTFVNENATAAGHLTISVSNYKLPAASPKWKEVDGSIAFTKKRLFNLSMLGVEARYVRLSFHVDKPGRIASLGLYGGETLERFSLRGDKAGTQLAWIAPAANPATTRPEDHLNFDFANLYAKSTVVYVSSGPLPSARRMIDDDNATGFRFALSDPHPTVIVELEKSARLRRVSALYTMKTPGRLDVYLLDEFDKGTLSFDHQKPVASVTDEDGNGKAAVDFNTQGARYVALRFTPAGSSAAPGGFEIAEIHAFGDVPLAAMELTAPDLYASNSSSLQYTGEGGTEISNKLGTIAVPPVLPAVSP